MHTNGSPVMFCFRGIPRVVLGHNIAKSGLRPQFPLNSMFEYQLLACRCWETDAAIRCVGIK